jgi:hypothetical protein
MMSVRQLKTRKKEIVRHHQLFIDSGGFMELKLHGRYTMSEDEYLDIIERVKPTAFFVQDYMCEPELLAATGETVALHQLRTLRSYLSLSRKIRERQRRSGRPFPGRLLPVLQGWTPEDYARHARMYRAAGVKLYTNIFGVGTLCCRTDIEEVKAIIKAIQEVSPMGLHAFGLKITALQDPYLSRALYSADSMAWSLHARKHQIKTETGGGAQNCWKYALGWAGRVEDFAELGFNNWSREAA